MTLRAVDYDRETSQWQLRRSDCLLSTLFSAPIRKVLTSTSSLPFAMVLDLGCAQKKSVLFFASVANYSA